MTCSAFESGDTFNPEHLQEWTWISPKQFAKAHLARYMPVFQQLDDVKFEAEACQPILVPPAPKEEPADFYVVKDGDSIWSIARKIVEANADCLFDLEVRRQDTRRVALGIAEALGAFHPDHVELEPGCKLHIAIPSQTVAAKLSA